MNAIQTEAELSERTRAMFSLTAKDDPTAADLDTIEELSAVIEAYEDEHYPLPEGSRLGVIRLLAQSHGITAEEIFGIDDEALAERFHVPASVFLDLDQPPLPRTTVSSPVASPRTQRP